MPVLDRWTYYVTVAAASLLAMPPVAARSGSSASAAGAASYTVPVTEDTKMSELKKIRRPAWNKIFKDGKLPDRITVKWLREHGACAYWVREFRRIYPRGAQLTVGNLLKAEDEHRFPIRWVLDFLTDWNGGLNHATDCASSSDTETLDRHLGSSAARWMYRLGDDTRARLLELVRQYREWEAKQRKKTGGSK